MNGGFIFILLYHDDVRRICDYYTKKENGNPKSHVNKVKIRHQRTTNHNHITTNQ